jgi:hypothetical protein
VYSDREFEIGGLMMLRAFGLGIVLLVIAAGPVMADSSPHGPLPKNWFKRHPGWVDKETSDLDKPIWLTKAYRKSHHWPAQGDNSVPPQFLKCQYERIPHGGRRLMRFHCVEGI